MSDLFKGLSNNVSAAQIRNSMAGKDKNNRANSTSNTADKEKADATNSTNKTKSNLLVEDKNKSVKVEDFLNLMISQLKNQDFMNPMDDTQYVTQLAQFSTMQQMQDLAYNSKANFMSSIIGKEITASKVSMGGNVSKTTGIVNKLSLVDGKFNFYIEGSDKAFTFEQIMEINNTKPARTSSPNKEKQNNDNKGLNSKVEFKK